MAQLVEWSLPTSEVLGSHPVIDKIYIEQCLLSNVLKSQKIKKKDKEAGNDHFLKKIVRWHYCFSRQAGVQRGDVPDHGAASGGGGSQGHHQHDGHGLSQLGELQVDQRNLWGEQEVRRRTSVDEDGHQTSENLKRSSLHLRQRNAILVLDWIKQNARYVFRNLLVFLIALTSMQDKKVRKITQKIMEGIRTTEIKHSNWVLLVKWQVSTNQRAIFCNEVASWYWIPTKGRITSQSQQKLGRQISNKGVLQ